MKQQSKAEKGESRERAMSREKIEKAVYNAVARCNTKIAVDQIIEMLKDDYNFEFPKEFDYTKCSKNRRGDEVLFVGKNEDGSIAYMFKRDGMHCVVQICNDKGMFCQVVDSDFDLIMDE